MQADTTEGFGVILWFLDVIEKAGKNYSACPPELPGGDKKEKTRIETEERIHEAVCVHIRGVIEDGASIHEIPFPSFFHCCQEGMNFLFSTG